MNKREIDTDLVRRAQAGEKVSFGQIVERYYPRMLGVANAYSNNRDDAADAVQNAFLLAYGHLGQLQDPTRIGPWLRRVTINACREGQRRNKPTESLDYVGDIGHDVTSQMDTNLHLEQILACLSPETRLTVALYYERELSLQQIGAFQEVPITTIKSRLRNARARLRKEWGTVMEETFTVTQPTTRSTKEAMLPQLLRRLDSVGFVSHIAFSPDGSQVVTAVAIEVTAEKFDSVIACWDAKTGDPLWTLPYTSWTFCPTFTPDGKRIAVAAGLPGRRDGREGLLLMLDAKGGSVLQTIPNVPCAKSIAITADGRFVALGGQEPYETERASGEQGVAVIHDLETGKRILKIAPHLNYITALAFSSDGMVLATDSYLRNADPEAVEVWLGSEIRLWSVDTGALMHKLARPKARGTRRNITFSPDGALLAAPNGREGEVLLWHPATGQLTRTLEGFGSAVFALAFSPDCAMLACGCGDKVVRLWDPRTGQLIRTMTEFVHPIYAIAFSPDGKTLATSDKVGLVQFWTL